MAEYPDTNAIGRRPKGAPAPRKSSDVLTDRLMQMRQRAEQAERERDETVAQNRELTEQLNTLHESLQQTATAAMSDSGEVEALRRELERVQTQAAAEMEAVQRQVSQSPQGEAAVRNVELEAELQAVRQETAVLRQAVKEKDKVMEELESQCRGLEDALEDSDREMDRLHQDSGQSLGDSTLSDGAGVLGGDSVARDSDQLYAFQEKYSSEILDGSDLVPSDSQGGPRRTVLLAAAVGLLLGMVAVAAVFLLTDWGGPSPQETVAEQAPSQWQPFAAAPTAPQAGSQSGAATASDAAKPAQESEPAELQPVTAQDSLRAGSKGPLLAAVPGGAFVMGNKRGMLKTEEQPAHRVELNPFFIGKREVTFAEYDAFAQATGRRMPGDSGWGRGERPVIDVSWDDALAYTSWLSEQTGKSYRLPTEAEWEYAARGGSASRYWWGPNPGSGRAVCFNCGSQWDGRSTAPVGSLEPNPYGLYDTAGNAAEWVADCYNPNYKGAPEDGGAWLSGDCSQRMVRGGAFNKPSSSLRHTARYQLPQDARFNMLGFRVVRE